MRSIPLIATLALLLAGCSSDEADPADGTPTGSASTTAPGATSPAGGTPSPTPSTPRTPTTHNVPLVGSAFVNGTLTIPLGDTVHWVHQDGTASHTVTADDGSFDSHPDCLTAGGIAVPPTCMAEGNTFDVTFDAKGSFPYACKVHASMTGTITVIG